MNRNRDDRTATSTSRHKASEADITNWPPPMDAELEHVAGWDVGRVMLIEDDRVDTTTEYQLPRRTFGRDWRVVEHD